jgi:hypothetical protein
VTNGGPPFQIDSQAFAEWLKVTKSHCPVILRHLMNFLQQWVIFDPSRTQPAPKTRIQPFLRIHAAAYLTASPTTARMTIGAALTKLMKYAKVFGSEKVGGEMTAFVDPLIHKYLAEELREATAELDRVRGHLQLANECCEQVLQSEEFTRAVMNWQRPSESDEQVSFLSQPQSINDADAARTRLK